MFKNLKKWILFNFFDICPECGKKLKLMGYYQEKCEPCRCKKK